MSQKVILQSETFKVSERQKDEADDSNEKEVVIEGIAVPYEQESRNGIIYSEESIKKAAETLVGKPFLFNHDPQQVLGRVEEAEPADQHLAFKVVADPAKEKVRDIKNGYVQTVSIQAMVSEADEGPDNRVDVDEFLELSSAPIPGFDNAKASAQAITVEEFVGAENKEQRETVIVRQPEDIDGVSEARWDPQDMEDFQSESAYFNAHTVWFRESPQSTEDVAFEVAREEDGDLLINYEGLNSAHDLAETSDDLGVDDVSKLRATLEDLREEFFPDREPLDADSSEPEEDEEEEEGIDVTDSNTVNDMTEEDSQGEEASAEDGSDANETEAQEQEFEQKLDRVIQMLEELVEAQDGMDDEDEEEETANNEEDGSAEEAVEPSQQPTVPGGGDGEVSPEALAEQFLTGSEEG